ncbi:hypothetical protein SRABI106_02713 [Rahnella aquatilis]|nr:hypothetical protein SRABI106_02713 [Rahnella aquatilis]
MHTAVVIAGIHITLHVRRLRIFTQQRVIVSGTGMRHRTQAGTVNAFRQQTFTNNPVGFIGSLFQVELFHQRTKHIRHRFVQCAGLAVIFQTCFRFGDPVGKLVPDNVDSNREAVKDFAVTVTKHHLLPVPEGILIAFVIMHRAEKRQPFVIKGISLIGLPEEIIGHAKIIIGFIHRHIAVTWLTFLTHGFPR